MSANDQKARRENPLLNIGLNIALPAIVLMQFSREDRLGPVYGLLLALAFPVGYGLYDFAARRGFNFYSALGFVSVLLTGGIGLLKLPVEWLAIKEAAVPFIAGVAVLISLRTRYPLIKTIIHQVIAVERVYAALRQRDRVPAYERRLVIADVHGSVRSARLDRAELCPGADRRRQRAGQHRLQRGARAHDRPQFPGHHRPLDHHSRHRALLPRQWHHQGNGPGSPGHLRERAGRQLNLTLAGDRQPPTRSG